MLLSACCTVVLRPVQDQPAQKNKAKWKYLQKYWHKGAFFQDNADDARGTAGGHDCVAQQLGMAVCVLISAVLR
jgi:hypothetical protein